MAMEQDDVRDEMVRYLEAANFAVEDIIERDPYPEIEHQVAARIFARKPDAIAR